MAMIFAWQIEVILLFTKGRTQFVKGKVEQTSSVARARTHIERDIGQIKDFTILNFKVPLTMVYFMTFSLW